MKKLLCSTEGCEYVFAHILDDRTIDLVRQKQKFKVLGKDYVFTGTCSYCLGYTTLIIQDGKLDDSELNFKENDNGGQETDESGNRGNESEEGDQGGGDSGGEGNPDENGEGDPAVPEPERKFTKTTAKTGSS